MHDNRTPADLDLPVDVGLLLRLEHAVADLSANPGPAEVAFPALLGAIGLALAWPVGAVWLPPDRIDGAGAGLRCTATWHEVGADVAEFAAASHDLTLPVGVGLPGRVWASGQPAWVRDTRRDPNMPRAGAAARAGLGAAFCFPATSRDGVEALIEFFCWTPLEPAPELLATVQSLGLRIGDALRRQRIDDTVRHSEARLRAVIEAALDCVVIADADGRVLEFNPAACRTFGYQRDQTIGRELAQLIVPPKLRHKHRAGLRRYLRTEQPRSLDRRLELTGMRADGSLIPVELTITRVPVDGPPMFAAYLRDLSDRRLAEAQLRASRSRVAEATVAERQRLERDLHDGAQQRLLSLGIDLVRARGALPAEPGRAGELLDHAIAALGEAAAELRDLARGIHPSSLTRYGLAAALADVARRAALDLRLGELPDRRFPASIEATAYFVVTEALTNVVKHAGGAPVQVDIELDPADGVGGALVVVVADRGPGGAAPERGTGLRGLADRLALLDGTLQVSSPLGGGTTLSARIPLPGAAVVAAPQQES